MHVWMLLKSELRRSLGVLGGMALVLALALSLAISTGLAERMLRSSSAQAADDFDLLVGAKGSAVSLLLGTVYLRDEPLSLVPAEALRTLKDSKRVRWYAPIALGDRIGNAAIVGTTKSMVIQGGARNVAEGRVFEAPLEAVAGAESGLKLGDEFLPVHGRVHGAGHAHQGEKFRVVGVMPPTGTPWDRAVMVPIERVWALHGPLHAEHEDHDEHEEHEGHDHHHAEGIPEPLEHWLTEDLSRFPGMSAIVVKPVTVADAHRLRQDFSKMTVLGADGNPVPLMGVFSGEVLVELYAAMGGASEALSFITGLTLVIALAATLVTGVLLGRLRLPTLLQLRVLGAPKRYVALLLWCIVMEVVGMGAVMGVILGWGIAELCAMGLTHQTGIAMSPALSLNELRLFLLTLALGGLCALIPAWAAGRARMN